MPVLTKQIGEGIHFRYIYCDKFKTNYFSAQFFMPLARETASSFSLLPAVLDRGCVDFPSKAAICKQLEALYSTGLNYRVGKRAEMQAISFSMDILDDKFSYDGTRIFDEAMALLSSYVFHPYLENGAFSSTFVEGEKKLLCDKIKARINNKTKYALTRCTEIMCEGEAYGISELGTVEEVEKITPESLYRAYLQLLREATVEVFFIGSKPIEEVLPYVEKMFSYTDRAPVSIETKKGSCGEVKNVCEPVNAVQGKLTLGFRMQSTPADGVLPLFNAVFGASPASKLFMNVREKLSLCYYCHSTADRAKGVMFVYSGVENQNADKAREEILLQLQEIIREAVTDEEMYCAKQFLYNSYRSIDDSASTIEAWYLGCIFNGNLQEPQELAAKIEALTVKDIAAFAEGIALDTVYLMKGTAKEDE